LRERLAVSLPAFKQAAVVAARDRSETFGDNAPNGTNDVQWVKALVDPHSRDVFAFQPQIVPANRVAVPAP
jgi:hypothetical protein